VKDTLAPRNKLPLGSKPAATPRREVNDKRSDRQRRLPKSFHRLQCGRFDPEVVHENLALSRDFVDGARRDRTVDLLLANSDRTILIVCHWR
jgi:hypothetical protein